MFAKAFRLFVSSTFQDFSEERLLLQKQVFPALEAHCANEGFGFRAVDMRWGVNDDAQLDQRTAEICLSEVVEAKDFPAPNLLILIGDRYGWVPLPFAIARDEFEAVRSWLIAEKKGDAVADLDRVYALDENHLVPGGLTTAGADLVGAYTLRSREDELTALRAPDAWAPVEARLRGALQSVARQLLANGQLHDGELEKYMLSLTEQEIRKGLEQLEVSDGRAAANSIAWVRTTKAAGPPVQALADLVQQALPEGNVLRAGRQAEDAGYGDHFVARITARLIAAVDAQIAYFKSRGHESNFALQTERAIHATFATERLRVFAGRASNLAAIAAHVADDARYPLVLAGISGSGKTALMARAAAEAKGAVVQRFVGASASSANQRNLLISVIEDLAALGVASKPEQWEDDDSRFVKQVRDVLSSVDQPVAMFIDALDQLRAPYWPLWLPPQLHPHVKLIVSVLDDEAFAAERNIIQGLRRILPAEAFLAIEPLSEEDGANILAGLKREARRGLSADQEAYILEQFQCAGASPLHLRVSFAIARSWRSSDDPRVRGLAGDVTMLIGQFLDELSSVHHHEPLLVRRALGLIAAGREGLSESEAIAVLSRDAATMAVVSSERFGAKTDRLPDSVWVRLKRSLDALLVEKGEEGEPVINFFHRQVEKVVRAQFYEPEKITLHSALTEFFEALVKEGGSWSRRASAELPYQHFHAGNRAGLNALMTDPAWIDRKAKLFKGVAELIADYRDFADAADTLQPLIGRTLRLAQGIIARDPAQTIAQLHGRLVGSTTVHHHQRFLAALRERAPDLSWIESRPALAPAGSELLRLETNGDPVTAIAALSNTQVASACGEGGVIALWDIDAGQQLSTSFSHGRRIGALARLTDGKLASGADDGTIKLWDVESGREAASIANQSAVCALLAFPDGRFASGSDDGCIRVFSTQQAREHAKFQDTHGRITALAALSGMRVASGSESGSIAVWDIGSGSELTRLSGGLGSIKALAALTDNLLASSAREYNFIIVWDIETGGVVARLMTPHSWTYSLLALPDGRLVSAGDDGAVRVWEPTTGEELACFQGHGGLTHLLTPLPNGNFATGSMDGTVRLWDPGAGSESSARKGPVERINALAVGPNGRVFSGVDREGVTTIYDPDTGQECGRLKGHFGRGLRLASLPNGHLASGAEDGTIRIWDPDSEEELQCLDCFSPIRALAALSNECLASDAGGRGKIHLWDLRSGSSTLLQGHSDTVMALTPLPDGRLASGSIDRTVVLWDLKQRASSTLQCGSSVRALAVLSDGRLASGADDGAIRLWDTRTGLELACLSGHTHRVTALAALPGGRLASASEDKTVRLWDVHRCCLLTKLELDGAVCALAARSGGGVVAGDSLGRLHWLEINDRSGVPFVHGRLEDVLEAPAVPIEAESFERRHRGTWSFVLVAALLLALATAAMIWGPYIVVSLLSFATLAAR